jgi:hypothetical protein
VPSIVPPLMSAVVTEPRSDQVAPAALGELVIVGEEMVGEALKTSRPEPVSSVIDNATLAEEIEVVKAPPVVVETNLSAVKPERVIVPEEVMPVAPDIVPVPEILIDGVVKKLSQPAPRLMAVSVA